MKTTSIFGLFAALLMFVSCGGSKEKAAAAPVDDDAFYSTQPVHSGLYDATSYDIQGVNTRKGKFDGRIFISLSADTASASAIYIYMRMATVPRLIIKWCLKDHLRRVTAGFIALLI